MRRKSERTNIRKTKSSPEKKLEKPKRSRTKRRKHSTSSDIESGEEAVVQTKDCNTGDANLQPQKTPEKETSPEESQDQVWQVKTADVSSDSGEIQKLKICLTRPPSTPESADRSPRSKRKHSRATSSSDTPSVEAEDKKKNKHKSKRLIRESKDESDKNHDDSLADESNVNIENTNIIRNNSKEKNKSVTAVKQFDDTPISTTNEVVIKQDKSVDISQSSTEPCNISEKKEESSYADTTVISPKGEEPNRITELVASNQNDSLQETKNNSTSAEQSEMVKQREDKIIVKLGNDNNEQQTEGENVMGSKNLLKEEKSSQGSEVSKIDSSTLAEVKSSDSVSVKSTNETDVVETSENVELKKIEVTNECCADISELCENKNSKSYERSDSTQEETIHNGQATHLVINRKRRWGSRVTKTVSRKSITISTDILKEIIPDVKPTEFDEVIEEKKHKKIEATEKIERPVLPKIVIDNTESVEVNRKEHDHKDKVNYKDSSHMSYNRKISIIKDDDIILRPPTPPTHKPSNILYITNLVRPFTLPQLKNLLQRTGRIVEDGFWIDRIKSKCYVKYETEDQAVETRHALHGVTWPVSNPKALQVDFSDQESFDKAKTNEDADNAKTCTIPGTVEDWLREQDLKRERGEIEKPWERKTVVREWDVGKGEKDKLRKEERPLDKRRHRTPERSPEPIKKFKKREEEAPAKLLDDLFRKTKTTPCIYWLPLSAETIAIKEEQRRKHMAEHERRMQELRRTHRRQ